jgi:predicted HNH restriction endonuclease
MKKPITPRSRIVSAIRNLWLRSRERAAVLKRDGYTCQVCMRKQSKKTGVKVQVHHRDGIDWQGIAELIRERVLNPEQITLCEECHAKQHGGKG